jgi:hypothetical protein
VLPYVDDFLFFASSEQVALLVRECLDKRVERLGLLRYPTKGFYEPTPFGHHMGINIDSSTGYFFSIANKLQKTSTHARKMIGRSTRNSRWLPVRDLHSLVGKAHYLFLAIPAARFFLRESNCVMGNRWGGKV